jgi:hypothetical protein
MPDPQTEIRPTQQLHHRFSDSEYARRLAAVRRVLDERGLPAVVCYGDRGAPGLVPYLANFAPRWEAFPLIPGQDEPVLWMQLYNHLPDARRVAVIPDTRWGGADRVAALAAELDRRGLAEKQIGLAEGDELHPVQQAYLDQAAFQCAYCIPGFILSNLALRQLRQYPGGR